jgi:class 3 adenylate cyclase
MARLSDKERSELPDRAFAYIDSKGRRLLPIHDAPHVRNALARFNQVRFESERARERAMRRLLQAAKRHGIVPVGFFTRRLREERQRSSHAADLPSGVLTLLFTDIEGSTRLVTDLGDDYPGILETVRASIARAVRRERGHEVEVRADEYFAVFETPASALRATVTIQRSLARAAWPHGHDVRVRAGLHTGAVTLTDLGYVGLAVHAAARVCSAGHGGQIVASADLQRAVGDDLPGGIVLRSLGRHRLAGLAGTHRLFQVEARGLLRDFGPLRTEGSTGDRPVTR